MYLERLLFIHSPCIWVEPVWTVSLDGNYFTFGLSCIFIGCLCAANEFPQQVLIKLSDRYKFDLCPFSRKRSCGMSWRWWRETWPWCQKCSTSSSLDRARKMIHSCCRCVFKVLFIIPHGFAASNPSRRDNSSTINRLKYMDYKNYSPGYSRKSFVRTFIGQMYYPAPYPNLHNQPPDPNPDLRVWSCEDQ